MKSRIVFGSLSALLFLGFSASCVLHGEPPAPKRVQPSMPFRCFTQLWDGSFKVVSTRYDKDSRQIIWTLEARKDASAPASEAEFSDGEGTVLGVNAVRFEPNSGTYKKGTKFRAIAPLSAVDMEEIGRVNVRERH